MNEEPRRAESARESRENIHTFTALFILLGARETETRETESREQRLHRQARMFCSVYADPHSHTQHTQTQFIQSHCIRTKVCVMWSKPGGVMHDLSQLAGWSVRDRLKYEVEVDGSQYWNCTHIYTINKRPVRLIECSIPGMPARLPRVRLLTHLPPHPPPHRRRRRHHHWETR